MSLAEVQCTGQFEISNYKAAWNVNTTANMITFTIQATLSSTQWMAIGMNADQQMVNENTTNLLIT